MATTRTIHHAALVGATALSVLSVYDAAWNAVSDRPSMVSDESDTAWAVVGTGLVLGVTYALLLLVLVSHRRVVASVGRTARTLHVLTCAALAVLAAGFLLVLPVLDGREPPAVLSGFIGAAFLVILLAGPALGLAVRREPDLRPGSLVLVTMIPVWAVTLLAAWLLPAVAHPAYLETVQAFGIALLGYRAAGEPAGVVRPAKARSMR